MSKTLIIFTIVLISTAVCFAQGKKAPVKIIELPQLTAKIAKDKLKPIWKAHDCNDPEIFYIINYGTKAEIEGEYHAGETVIVIDDLATTGGSKFEAIEKLTAVGLVVKDVVVLVDRQSGAKESLEQAGYSMHAVLTISQLLEHWEKNGKVEKDKMEETRKFLGGQLA